MAKTKTPAPKRAGTRRSKQSQARLDAILAVIGDDLEALTRLLATIAAASSRKQIALRHQLVVDKSTVG